MAIDSNNLYWSDFQGIHAVSVNGGTSSDLAIETDGRPACLQVDSGNVYWATLNDIKKVSVSGGVVTSIVHIEAGTMQPGAISRTSNRDVSSNCIAVNSDYVFFGKKNALYRIAK